MSPESTALPEPHNVPIFDARLIAGQFSLDREGFALVRHPTIVRNFYDDKEMRAVYYPAAEAFLRATLKADRVVIFDHTVRKRVEGAADVRGAGPRQPATRVHVDQTDASGANRVREHLPDEADELLKGRVQVINLWRPIRGPVRDTPLAMLDGQTVAPGDLVASDLIYPNRRGETYSVKYNPGHRWYYIPEMTADEALLLEVLRFRDRRPHAIWAAHRLHRSDDAGRCAAAREHRTADAGVPQAVTSFPSPRLRAETSRARASGEGLRDAR